MSFTARPTAPPVDAAVDRPSRQWRRRLLRGLTAGVLVGLTIGVLARAMMRVVALTVGEPTAFHPGISAAIVGMLTVVTLPGALLLGLWQGRGRWVAAGLAGVLVLGFHLPEALEVVTGDEAAVLSPARWVLLAGVLGAWAVALVLLVWLLARRTRLPHPERAAVRPGATSGT